MNSYKNPLEERYSSEEMLYNFSPNNKFRNWRKLWIALAEIQKDLGVHVPVSIRGVIINPSWFRRVKDALTHEQPVRHL